MSRPKNPKADEAKELYLLGKSIKEISEILGVPQGTLRRWKSQYKWDEAEKVKSNDRPVPKEIIKLSKNDDINDQRKLFCLYYVQCFNSVKAYQKAYGCSWASANFRGPALLKDDRVKKQITELKQGKLNRLMLETEDLFQKYTDIAFSDITDYVSFGTAWVPIITNSGPLEMTDKDTGEKKVVRKETNIVRFKDSKDIDGSLIQEVSQGKDGARIKLIDKQKAMNWLADHMDLATAEQKAKIDKLKAETERLIPMDPDDEVAYNGIPAAMIASAFAAVVHSIHDTEYLEYVFPGGRGSTKSSFVSLSIIDLLMTHEDMHAVVTRRVKDTIRKSVYQQVMWAIDALGLSDEFHATVTPLEITRISTGQKIFFAGADDPGSFKSIKAPFGYIGMLWFEELDQFDGPESVRKIEQSVIRGGDLAYIFKSFNPPKSAQNWANKYIKLPKQNRLIVESNYLDVPKKWLGKPFLDEAEFLKEVNPDAYDNEYMGVANGVGGSVFDNITIREITDQEIASMDRRYRGVDWGWYPDPWAYNDMYYNAAQHRLIIIDEDECNKTSNENTARRLVEKHGITPNDKITCDSAENKSVSDYKEYGLFARGARKGPGSVDYSMKWLQSLTEIVIDNTRTPKTAEEFLNYEYERDKEDEIVSGYPDINNHHIDAVRYALEEIWRRRGQ